MEVAHAAVSGSTQSYKQRGSKHKSPLRKCLEISSTQEMGCGFSQHDSQQDSQQATKIATDVFHDEAECWKPSQKDRQWLVAFDSF
jgi:hypothetical protein